MAGKPVSGVGSGGMITKIEAGKIALGAGCNMVIASGHEMHPLKRIREGARCTWFVANASALQSRKRWIAGTLQPIGHLVVDEGAARGAGQGQEPAAGRREEGRRQLRARRHGVDRDAEGPRDRARPRRL